MVSPFILSFNRAYFERKLAQKQGQNRIDSIFLPNFAFLIERLTSVCKSANLLPGFITGRLCKNYLKV